MPRFVVYVEEKVITPTVVEALDAVEASEKASRGEGVRLREYLSSTDPESWTTEEDTPVAAVSLRRA